ncbi:Pro-kumamolisin, activation domain-containing protein [Xylariaceae sp. FL0804]|nr:Pro-kumamolisin, activation domain-containing protein [Xylariaceae sp. FL0804]
MQWQQILTVSALALTAAAVPLSSSKVLHEKRQTPSPLKRRARVEPDAIIPLRIGLTQTNLDLGYDRLMEVSHPDSPRYGQHLTAEEVHKLFAPTEETVDTVKSWLIESGIPASNIRHYENKGWLAIDLPAAQAERLLLTEYYEHASDHSVHLGADSYYLPTDVAPHVDLIKPGVKLSAAMKKRTLNRRTSRAGKTHGPSRMPHGPANAFPSWVPPSLAGIPADLATCSVNITIRCIQALYDIPLGTSASPENKMGLYESYDAFDVPDIELYFKHFAPWVRPGTVPQVDSVDGGTAPVPVNDSRVGGESIIDIDLAQSLIYPQTITLYQVDDLPNSSGETDKAGFLNTFLDAVDGSYCNYTAYGITGDSPSIDATYPDPLPGGYEGQLECGKYELTRVVSISYGEAEISLPKNYVERQCNELMKLGLQGHSILAASGDYGVASFPGSNDNEFGCLSGDGGETYHVYNPDYPCGCPFITSVGATRLYPNDTVFSPESAMQVNLTAFNDATGVQGSNTPPYDFFATGGGFSNYFTPPSYQAAAVSEYLDKYKPDVPYYSVNADASNVGANGGVYNIKGRAYPDVSANGAFLLTYVDEELSTYFGTSLASPIFGAVLTLINEKRTEVGKGPVGFVNPTLYSHPEVLNDITNGSNPNCGSSGFRTAPGWDPVTGLGTPNYPKMLDLWLALP